MKLRKFLALILSVLVLVTALPVWAVTPGGEISAWDGSIAEGYAGGDGSYADPYQISSSAELAYLSAQVNAGITYEDTYFVLTNDIVLNDIADFDNWGTSAPANSWEPIGGSYIGETYDQTYFGGHLNGMKHRIIGLYCHRPDAACTGLFGLTNYGSITNLGLSYAYVAGYDFVGGLVGQLGYGTTLEKCYSEQSIVIADCRTDIVVDYVNCIGGLVGRSEEGSLITNCYNASTISCAPTVAWLMYAGGVVGQNLGEVTYCHNVGTVDITVPKASSIGGVFGGTNTDADRCYNSGTIRVTAATSAYNVGGVAGLANFASVTENCFNTASVTVSGGTLEDIGGVVGAGYIETGKYVRSGWLSNVYNAGTVTVNGTSVNGVGGAIGYVRDASRIDELYYLDTSVTPVGTVYGNALTTQQMKSSDSYAGFDFADVWTFATVILDGYPTLRPAPCNHTYVNSVCVDCGYECPHNWAGGVCTDCTLACNPHTWDDGICTNCGVICRHDWQDDVCADCGRVCTHTWVGGICSVCAKACAHEWNSQTGLCNLCYMRCAHLDIVEGYCQSCHRDMTTLGEIWDRTFAEGFAGGDGSQEHPYQISNARELAYLAWRVNNGDSYPDTYFVLTDHIYLNDPAGYEYWGVTPPANQWILIGTGEYVYYDDINPADGNEWAEFSGHFDGCGYEVRGLYMNNNENGNGLFGDVHNGSVKNVGVTQSYLTVTEEYAIGAVVVDSYSSTVSGCYSDAVIEITSENYSYNVGGVISYAEYSVIENCVNRSTITISAYGVDYIGGVAGFLDSTTIDKCANLGNIAITVDWVAYDIGGVVGMSGDQVTNCYNAGDVTVTSTAYIGWVGGVIGDHYASEEDTAILATSYNVGTIRLEAYEIEIGAVGAIGAVEKDPTDCYYLNTSIDPAYDNGVGTARTAAEMKLESGYPGFDFKFTWEVDASEAYPYPHFQNHTYENGVCTECGHICPHDYYDGTCTYCGAVCTDHQWSAEYGHCSICTTPCDHEQVKDDICETCGKDVTDITPWDGCVALRFAGGDGTKGNPYRIATAEQLALLAYGVRAGIRYYQEAYVVLTSDIDMGGLPLPSIGIVDEYSWEDSQRFTGNFNGRGHKIINYYNTEQGLFGNAGGENTGKIAGVTDPGRIANVHVYGQIVNTTDVYQDIGGIVGRGEHLTLKNCSFHGTIRIDVGTDYQFFGGLGGEMERGYILDCVADAEIRITGEQPWGVGGILGGAEYNPALIDGCINQGSITTVSPLRGLGSIVGVGGTVLNTANHGDITVTNDASEVYFHAIGGHAVNCYSTGDIRYEVALNEAPVPADFIPESNTFYTGRCIYQLAEDGEWIGSPLMDSAIVTSPDLLQTLNAYVEANPTYEYVDYDDNAYSRPLNTWKAGDEHPVYVDEYVTLTLTATVGEILQSGTTTQYLPGDTVTVTATYAESDYRFVGWYVTGDYSKVLTSTRSYSFTVTEEMLKTGVYALTARYEPVARVSVTVNAPLFSINGSVCASQHMDSYLPGTTLTVSAIDTNDFAYWVDAGGKILSRSATYTFKVVNTTVINAVYHTKVEQKKIVIFESAYHQVIKRVQITADELDALVFPPVPAKAGYGPGEWSMTPEELRAAFENTDVEVITLTPVYPTIIDTATVTVVGGIVPNTNGETSAAYTLNTPVTVVADEPSTGMKFAYWTDESGNILGYNTEYVFFLAKDITLTAVFVEDEQAVEKVGVAEILEVKRDLQAGKVSVIAMLTVPEGCTIDFAGILASTNAEHASDLTIANAPIVRGDASDKQATRYTWTAGNSKQKTIWVRAYLVYTDEAGVSHTVYGDIVTVSYETAE